ncbi:MAG: flippase [Nanoarchaeota archaeon]
MKKNEKELNNYLKFLAKSATIVLIGIVLSKVFTYIYKVFIARWFGPEIYGLYSLAISVLGLFVFIALLGIDAGLVRFIPFYMAKGENKKLKYLLKFSFACILLSSIIVGVILFLLSDFISITIFHEAKLAIFLKIFSILVPISSIIALVLSILNGYEKIGLYSFIENISKNATNVIFLALLVLLGFGEMSVPASYLLGGISVLFISYFIIMKYVFSKSKTKNRKDKLGSDEKKSVRKEFLIYSIPLLFFGVVNIIFSWIDSVSVGYFKSATEVGIYNAAMPIALLLGIAPQLFIKLFLPLISKEYGMNKMDNIKELTKQVTKWIILINLPLLILLFLFPEGFINLFFGKEYVSAALSLRILVIGYFVFSTFRISDRILAMAGKTKLLLLNVLAAVIVNIVLNIILIPRQTIFGIDNSLGVTGAAIATTISNVLLGLLFLFQTKYYFSIFPFRRKLIRLVIASLISGMIIFISSLFININLVALVLLSVLFVIAYIILILLFRGLDRNDVLIIKSFFTKIGLNQKMSDKIDFFE